MRPETAHAWSPDRSDQHTHRAFNESYFCLVQAQSFAQLHTPLLSHSQLFLPHALQLMVSSSFSLISCSEVSKAMSDYPWNPRQCTEPSSRHQFQTREVSMGFSGRDGDLFIIGTSGPQRCPRSSNNSSSS